MNRNVIFILKGFVKIPLAAGIGVGLFFVPYLTIGGILGGSIGIAFMFFYGMTAGNWIVYEWWND